MYCTFAFTTTTTTFYCICQHLFNLRGHSRHQIIFTMKSKKCYVKKTNKIIFFQKKLNFSKIRRNPKKCFVKKTKKNFSRYKTFPRFRKKMKISMTNGTMSATDIHRDNTLKHFHQLTAEPKRKSSLQ